LPEYVEDSAGDVIHRAVNGTLEATPVGADRPQKRRRAGATAPGNGADGEIDAFIARRAGSVDEERAETYAQKAEREYREMSEEMSQDRREVHRVLWQRYHLQQAERYKRMLAEQVAHHEQQAEKYRNLPIGACSMTETQIRDLHKQRAKLEGERAKAQAREAEAHEGTLERTEAREEAANLEGRIAEIDYHIARPETLEEKVTLVNPVGTGTYVDSTTGLEFTDGRAEGAPRSLAERLGELGYSIEEDAS
jgi:hypothetical protein